MQPRLSLLRPHQLHCANRHLHTHHHNSVAPTQHAQAQKSFIYRGTSSGFMFTTSLKSNLVLLAEYDRNWNIPRFPRSEREFILTSTNVLAPDHHLHNPNMRYALSGLMRVQSRSPSSFNLVCIGFGCLCVYLHQSWNIRRSCVVKTPLGCAGTMVCGHWLRTIRYVDSFAFEPRQTKVEAAAACDNMVCTQNGAARKNLSVVDRELLRAGTWGVDGQDSTGEEVDVYDSVVGHCHWMEWDY